MSDIVLVHRKTNQDFQSSSGPLPFSVWKTCLRQIIVTQTDPEKASEKLRLEKSDDVLQNEKAAQLLLEILCGLHSPVFGETEIFGQFKKHLETLPEDHVLRQNTSFTQFLFKSVKEVRKSYLKMAGGLSYGHIVRKKIREFETENISLWGFGQLGQEISPWLKEKQVQIIVRKPFLSDEFSVVSAPFRQKTQLHVIAAPLHDDEVMTILGDGTTELVIDLRGQTELSHSKVIPLFQIMKEIEELKQEQKTVAPECRAAIQQLVEKYFSTSWHRPFCWEDLCG